MTQVSGIVEVLVDQKEQEDGGQQRCREPKAPGNILGQQHRQPRDQQKERDQPYDRRVRPVPDFAREPRCSDAAAGQQY